MRNSTRGMRHPERSTTTSTFKDKIAMFARTHAPSFFTLSAGLLILASVFSGCTGGFSEDGLSEGDRCNPLDTHDECGGSLVCTGQGTNPAIAFCPENYCCPLDTNGNIAGSNPLCQPGCSGGALAICKADQDPGACAFAFPDASVDAGVGSAGGGE